MYYTVCVKNLYHFQTFSALCLLIKNLEPTQKEMESQQLRTSWLNKVHLYRPVVEKVLTLHSEDPELYRVHSQRSVQMARFVLQLSVYCM